MIGTGTLALEIPTSMYIFRSVGNILVSATELLTPTEAAVVAGVEVRDVNRMIDEDILPSNLYRVKDGRKLQANACVFVAFYFHTADKLTAKERTNVIESASRTMRANRYYAGSFKDGFLTVDLTHFANEAERRHRELSKARTAVEELPDVLGGIPVFKGTRIPVRDVAASLKKGVSKERLLKAFPALSDEQLALALLYVDAIPPRGRPRRPPSARAGQKVVRRKSRA